jgi:hypothetical protein
MALTVGKYTFSAWLRRGIGVHINEADTLGAGGGSVKERASVPVDVLVNTQPVHKDFALMAPGDVIGINPDAVLRCEPRDWVTDFEPNYLPFVEFYEEDLPWRYTPARAVGDRLRPWLALLVLAEETVDGPGEFVRHDRQLPLPAITVTSTASLPPPEQTWAWAHVHTNDGFPAATDFERFLESLQRPDHPNSDRIISRLMCPRRLAANTAYGAFVVPAFETGRLAGLGHDPAAIATVDAQQPSWTSAAGSVEFPVYFQWRFRTGENEDFESLVRKLVPRPADPRLGVRPMDGEKPGWGMAHGTEIGPILPTDEKQSVVGLEGALKAPTTRPRPESVDPSLPFFAELEQKLNEAAERAQSPSGADLPVITPPIYGQYHALRDRVDVSRDDWLDALNRDPRTRASAGFGVRVVQDNQEDYVARAWAMVQKILEANRRVRLLGYGMHVSQRVYLNLGSRLAPAAKVSFYAPLLRKVRGSPTTLAHQLVTSTLPPVAVSGAMRRLIRPRGALGRRVLAADASFSHGSLIQAMAEGRLTAAPPKPVPDDLATDTEVIAHRAARPQLPAWLRLLARIRWVLLVVVLVLLLVLGILTGAWLLVAVLAVLAVAALLALNAVAARAAAIDAATALSSAVTDPSTLAPAIERVPPRPDFRLVETDPVVPPQPAAGQQVSTSIDTTSGSPTAATLTDVSTFTPAAPGADTVEAEAFRRAAAALGRRLALSVAQPERTRFDLANAAAKLSAAIEPRAAFPRRAASEVHLHFDPAWLLEPEHLVPAMAYPDFDDPMYAKLRDLSSELLLPNLQLLPPDTLTLLETNPPFIESYLVGLNYEFGKELLWREYPTDRRGSYFRQFWDVRGIIAEPTGASPADLAELGRDIVPLDRWGSGSALGSHRNPRRPGGEQLILTVRGELLERYPNTLIYAQKAHLATDAHGRPLPDPVVAEVASDADVAREILFPAFKAGVEPDIAFFGFDLTVEAARGAEDPRTASDDWGWYFVIQQLPGEPRFGMDGSFSPDDPRTPLTWDDLAWTLFPGDPAFIDTATPPQGLVPAGPGEALGQWGADSARMASILYQRPVMILVHAKEMLEGLG